MGDHYDLYFTFDFKPDLPLAVANALDYVTGKNPPLENLPQDTKFSTTWKNLLVVRQDDTLLRFAGHAISVLSTAYRRELPENRGKVYRQTLTFRTDLHDDILFGVYLLFLDWIAPYIETEGYIGYFLCSGRYFYPTLILCKNSKLELFNTNPEKSKGDG